MEEIPTKMYLYAVVIIFLFAGTEGQVTEPSLSSLYGVVSLSSSPSEEAPLISATLNGDTGNFTVNLLLYDNITNSPTVNGSASFDEDVLVYCVILTPYEDGNTAVLFGVEEIPAFAISGTLDFSIVEQGRRVEVQCWGETSPNSVGSTSYFTNETSAGPSGFLVVKKSPVVSFCEPVIIVPNSPVLLSSTVYVELSEPVADFPVTVSCEIIGVLDANGNLIPRANNSLWLVFQDKVVQPGDGTSVRVIYNIIQLGDIVQVACSAESTFGTQYLTNTSTGELAIFRLASGSVALIPTTADIVDRSIRVFLVLGSQLDQNEGTITFFCYADPVTSYSRDLFSPTCVTPEDAFIRPTPGPVPPTTPALTTTNTTNTTANVNATTPTPSQAPTTTPTPAATTQGQSTTSRSLRPSNVSTTPWRLQEAEVVFEEGDYFKELVLRLDSATLSFSGAILVSCCAPDDINSNPKYVNASDGMVFYANVLESRPINWTDATDFANRFVESLLPNPAYVDLSPCPCDLTSGHCDTDCCCDQDCIPADILVFNCTDSSAANQTTIYDCTNSDLYKADYSPLLCVQTSNSPYLGLYYGTVSALRDSRAFSSLKDLSTTSRDTSYQDNGRRSLEYASPSIAAYSNGDPVELLYEQSARGFLALPQMSLSGECLWTSPVQFQEDFSTQCVLPPIQLLCSEYSPFSALMFLRSTDESYPPCPVPPTVASQYSADVIAPTEVEYYCLDDISEYLVDRSGEGDILGAYDLSLFQDYENTTTDQQLVPVRCQWDDGYTQPPAPSFDNGTGVCLNSVLNVNYEMFWRGGEIVSIKGKVIMGAIPLMKDDSIGTEDGEEFVPPPPMTEPPTESTPLTTFSATDGFTFITDVTDVFETVFTDVGNFTTDNTTGFAIFDDASTSGTPVDNMTQPTPPGSMTGSFTQLVTVMDNSTQQATTGSPMDNSTQQGTSGSPTDNATQASTGPTPLIPAMTSQSGTSNPGTSPTFSSAPGSTILVSTAAPSTIQGTTASAVTGITASNVTMDTATTSAPNPNATMDIQSGNATIDITTGAPPTTTPGPYIPINTTPLNITLLFSTQFTYLPEITSDPLTGLPLETPEPFKRSGNPGYIIGKPLLTGIATQTPLVFPTTPGPPINCTEFPTSPRCIVVPENETVYVFELVDDDEINQLKMFSPGHGSLCGLSSTTAITFGEDTMSGCILRMSQSELQNCSVLALYMQEQLRALVPADRVGKRGDSNVTVEEDWALVFNPDEHPFEPTTTAPPTTEPLGMETTADLPTLDPGQAYVEPEPPVQTLEELMSICHDIPTSVNVEVLITEAGVYSGVPQYEVLAARVTYTTSTVKLSCSGANGASCFLADTPIVASPSGNGSIVQSFPVYSTVTYTTTPAQEPEPVIMYYRDRDPDLCKQDICAAELLYPLTGQFEGDSFSYSLAASLLIVLITTAFFIITWPCTRL